MIIKKVRTFARAPFGAIGGLFRPILHFLPGLTPREHIFLRQPLFPLIFQGLYIRRGPFRPHGQCIRFGCCCFILTGSTMQFAANPTVRACTIFLLQAGLAAALEDSLDECFCCFLCCCFCRRRRRLRRRRRICFCYFICFCFCRRRRRRRFCCFICFICFICFCFCFIFTYHSL